MAIDVGALRGLMGHSRIDTTQLYTDEIDGFHDKSIVAGTAGDLHHRQRTREKAERNAGNERTLLHDSDLRGELVTRGRQRAAMFRWDTTAQRTLEVLRRAV